MQVYSHVVSVLCASVRERKRNEREGDKQIKMQIDRSILDVLRSVKCKGSYQGKTKCSPITSKKNSDSLFNTPLRIKEILEK